MDINIVRLIARRIPAIYDVNPPHGGWGQVATSRVEAAALNPQPLPPLELGALMGREILRLAWFAELTGAEVRDEVDDWCPTYPKRPHLPPHVPWPPDPGPDPEPWWFEAYAVGLLGVLVQAEGALAESRVVGATIGAATKSLEALGRQG